MLRIRPEQIDAMRVAAVTRFETEVAGTLRARFTDFASAGQEETLAFVRRSREQGLRSGIYEPDDVRRYVHYLAYFGPDFGEDEVTAWAAEILADGYRTGTEKIQALDAEVRRRGETPP